MNTSHIEIINFGNGWVRFWSISPNTLDQILSNDYLIEALIEEYKNIWYVEFLPFCNVPFH